MFSLGFRVTHEQTFVAADEQREAASCREAIVGRALTFYLLYWIEWFHEGCAIDRSLRSSTAATRFRVMHEQTSVAADEQREAASGRKAIVGRALTFYLLYWIEWFHDGCAIDRSLRSSTAATRFRVTHEQTSVAADEQREAASGREAIVGRALTFYLLYWIEWCHDGCAIDRSLRFSTAATRFRVTHEQTFVAADEQREAASGREAIVGRALTFYLLYWIEWFHDGCAIDRSLRSSTAATIRAHSAHTGSVLSCSPFFRGIFNANADWRDERGLAGRLRFTGNG